MFIYIGGEGTLGGTPTGFVAEYASQHSAMITSLEHRWYGRSIPGDITSTKDLATLTVEQAIADLATFVTWFDGQLTQGAFGFAPKAVVNKSAAVQHVWLAVGGSYPG